MYLSLVINAQLTLEIILNAELNLTNYPLFSKDAISFFILTRFFQTAQDNSPTGAIILTHQTLCWLFVCLSPLCRVRERTRSFTMVLKCKMSEILTYVLRVGFMSIAEYQWSVCWPCDFRRVTESIVAICNTDMVSDLRRMCDCVCVCSCVFVSDSFTVAWALCQSSTELWSCSQLHPLTPQLKAEPTTDQRHSAAPMRMQTGAVKKSLSSYTSQSGESEGNPELSRLVCEAGLPDGSTTDSCERPREDSLKVIYLLFISMQRSTPHIRSICQWILLAFKLSWHASMRMTVLLNISGQLPCSSYLFRSVGH